MLRTALVLLLMAMPPQSQDLKNAQGEVLRHDVRARPVLLFGKGDASRTDYWDVVITRQPKDGVLIKLPYTKKGGKLMFDIHHRVPMSADFGLPVEITTIVEVMTGGTTSLGQYTLVDQIVPDSKFEETLTRTSSAEIDRHVTPMFRRSVVIDIKPGPQSLSVVGQSLTITRGSNTTRIDTPGTRIAMVSNIRFEAINELNPLKKSTGQ